MEGSKTLFSSSHGHAKEFLRNLQTNWACALKSIQQPYFRETEGRVTKLVLFFLYQRLSRSSSFEKTENEMRG